MESGNTISSAKTPITNLKQRNLDPEQDKHIVKITEVDNAECETDTDEEPRISMSLITKHGGHHTTCLDLTYPLVRNPARLLHRNVGCVPTTSGLDKRISEPITRTAGLRRQT